MTGTTPEAAPGPTGPLRRRRPPAWVGVAVLLAGVGLLAYVGWQLHGTNVVAERDQRDVVAALQQQWRADSGSSRPAASGTQVSDDTSDPDPSAASDSADAGDPRDLYGAYGLVRIPAFGAEYVMPVSTGVGDDALAQGFGHFEGTAGPGQVGNFAITAHRVTHGEPLRDMPELEPGDEVTVETRDAVYRYRLDTNPNELIVPLTDVWVIAPDPVNPRPGGVGPVPDARRLITLTTCSELVHTEERMVAFGHLVSEERKPVPG